MSFVRKFTSSLKSLNKSEQGTVALITGLAAIPLFLSAGVAVDFARNLNVETNIQHALDAGALAGAAAFGASDATRISIAENAFNANLNSRQISQTNAKFRIEKGYMKASVEAKVDTTFMKVAGIDHTTITADAEVNLLSTKKAEIALVLDFSGSMGEMISGEQKYVSLQKAVSKLVDDLASLEKGKIKMGVVPFSHHVYTTLPNAYVAGQPATGNWTGCTVDRHAPYNVTANTPVANNVATKWGQAQDPVHLDYGCNGWTNLKTGWSDGKGYVYHGLKTVDLTTDIKSIKPKVNSMTPYAWTHIAVGMEFGYHMLTPNAPFTQGVKMNDEDTSKFIVLLTDGKQTEPGFGPAGRSVAQGEQNLEALCSAAKKDGIQVLTLAFDLDDSSTRKRLQGCATDKDKFFVANNGKDLSVAFESIRNEVAQNIFLSK